MTIAVISGDLVRSRAMSDAELSNAISTIKRTIADYSAHHHFARGDGFQIRLTNVADALPCALAIKLALIAQRHNKQGSDCRLAIGIGEERMVRADNATNSGAAYERSGLGLDRLKGNQLELFGESGLTGRQAQLLQITTLLVRWLSLQVNDLTPKQAQVLQLWLANPSIEQSKIAQQLGIDQSNVSRHLNRCNANLIWQTIEQVTRTITDDLTATAVVKPPAG
ncbi:helix-turn-helix transcriptional regulator [Ferrimonas senticii]|uniref:helix-turn-helix transcriptional regulator n=1 Tax=Ferrimonas senticii TaxID=394566 RepID=UPI000410605F|nr:MarR family winged helix-turn-helix transcriptional regulator [Ferrimonas senticii]